ARKLGTRTDYATPVRVTESGSRVPAPRRHGARGQAAPHVRGPRAQGSAPPGWAWPACRQGTHTRAGRPRVGAPRVTPSHRWRSTDGHRQAAYASAGTSCTLRSTFGSTGMPGPVVVVTVTFLM